MRVIAGILGGRAFDAPKGHTTHPMSEKARGGLFNALGDIQGLTVLDMFAGSGALSYEAISRGAKSAIAVDSDKTATNTIIKNLEGLAIADRVTVVKANCSGWSNNNQNKRFDLVLCDPPYDAVQTTLIQKLVRHVLPSGMLVLSWPKSLEIVALSGMELIKAQSYGDAQLAFYRKIP
jgi:16S rRNA (guanine966-N2)-methyltransferase